MNVRVQCPCVAGELDCAVENDCRLMTRMGNPMPGKHTKSCQNTCSIADQILMNEEESK